MIDLVVAFPVCVVAHAMSANRRSKRWMMATGAALALVWMAGLRNPAALLSMPAPALQAAALATMAISVAMAWIVNRQRASQPQAELASVTTEVKR